MSLVYPAMKRLYQPITDPLVHPLVSAHLGLDLLNAGKVIRENSAQLKIPLLLLHGEKDRLVNASGTREFASQLDGNVKYVEMPGAYHELHNEPNKEEVFQIWLDWLDSVLGSTNK